MEISEEKLQELNEEQFIRGQRWLLLRQLKEILRELGVEKFTKERVIAEREEAVLTLRSICQDHGDNDWPEDLHLADIINKHLGNHLDQ